jgi:phosphoglycolate phosphatase
LLVLNPIRFDSSRFDASRFDAAIVDLDGTMVDTLGDFAESLNRMLRDLDLPPVPPAAIELMVGKGSEHLIHSALVHVMTGGGAADAMRGRRGKSEGAVRSRLGPLPAPLPGHQRPALGAVPGCDRGAEGAARAGPPAGLPHQQADFIRRPLMAAKGLDGFFELVFGGDAFERKKPDPLPLLKTCEALGTVPARTLMMGDSSNDARAARAAGCPVVLVTYGYNHGEPVRGVDADGFVDSLAELL